MRDIKFRAKPLDPAAHGFDFVCGGYYKEPIDERAMFEEETTIIVTKDLEHIPVLKETVGEYTGLKDKNGKEIYEGDIVETEHQAKGIVIWDELAAKFAFDCHEPMWSHPIHVMGGEKEIIGNIHENKDLI